MMLSGCVGRVEIARMSIYVRKNRNRSVIVVEDSMEIGIEGGACTDRWILHQT